MESQQTLSSLHPAAGSGAALIDQLGTVLYVGGAIIFAAVMALAIYGVYARARSINARYWIMSGGLALPIFTLTVLLVYSLAVSNGLTSIGSSRALQLFLECFGGGSAVASSPPPADGVLRIHVIGKQWWWDVRYEFPNARPEGGANQQIGGGEPFVLANEIHIPVNQPVELLLSSADVIHSFWAPSLAGKVDMIPGRTTRLRVQTSEEGTFRAVCAEYCGGQHALMALVVVTQNERDFAAWLARQATPAREPDDPFLMLGRDAFFKGDCDSCHTIRGTRADGHEGPDLTHVGSRATLAAGTFDNHVGTFGGWIAGTQDLKRGAKMPTTLVYTGTELRALSAWLESLE